MYYGSLLLWFKNDPPNVYDYFRPSAFNTGYMPNTGYPLTHLSPK